MTIETRAYGPDLTPEERACILERVSLLEERVIMLREIPVQSPSSVGLMLDRVGELAAGWDRFVLIVDLTEANRPNAEARAALKRHASVWSVRAHPILVVPRANVVIAAMAKVVTYGLLGKPADVYASLSEAGQEARRVLSE